MSEYDINIIIIYYKKEIIQYYIQKSVLAIRVHSGVIANISFFDKENVFFFDL